MSYRWNDVCVVRAPDLGKHIMKRLVHERPKRLVTKPCSLAALRVQPSSVSVRVGDGEGRNRGRQGCAGRMGMVIPMAKRHRNDKQPA